VVGCRRGLEGQDSWREGAEEGSGQVVSIHDRASYNTSVKRAGLYSYK
jgi:hypothetical protein